MLTSQVSLEERITVKETLISSVFLAGVELSNGVIVICYIGSLDLAKRVDLGVFLAGPGMKPLTELS